METHLPASADGLAFIHSLRRDLATRRVPIVVVSAAAYREDAIRAAMAGCDLFLVKPCLPSELLRSVRRMLRRTAARRIAKAVTSTAHHRQQPA
jgi:two-component system phosphate regulon response regulator PhoB